LDQDRENVDRLRPAHQELVAALTKVGTAMNQAAGADQAAGGADFGTNGATGETEAEAGAEDETTVEGEFREVGSER
jgi:hypothetical protein